MRAPEERKMLDMICGLVGRSVRADTVCILESVEKSHAILLGSWGGYSDSLVGYMGLPYIDAQSHSVLMESVFVRSRWCGKYPLSTFSPSVKRLIAVSLPQGGTRKCRYIAALFNSPDRNLTGGDVTHLTRFAGLANFVVGNSRERGSFFKRLSLRDSAYRLLPSLQPGGEEAVLSFLSETLVRRPTILNLDGVPIVVLRQWEETVKETQVKALEYLRAWPSTVTVDLIAYDLAESIESIYHGIAFDAVVPVSSAESCSQACLSVLVAEKVSRAINRPFIDILARGKGNGLSHSSNTRLHRANGFDICTLGHALVIRDAASSGLEIKQVMDALCSVGVSGSTLVWVGG
jgi:hypothetical protein